MVTRRKFLGALAGITAVTALAGAGLRVPKREDIEVDSALSHDFSTENLRYKATERFSHAVTDWRSVYGSVGL